MTDTLTPDQFNAFAETMALGDNERPRMLTEAEVRAAFTLFWRSTRLARVTVAQWAAQNRKPTKDDMIWLALNLRGAEVDVERLAARPPSDGHSLDPMIDRFERWTRERQAEVDPAP